VTVAAVDDPIGKWPAPPIVAAIGKPAVLKNLVKLPVVGTMKPAV